MITVLPHALLDARWFVTELPRPLSELPSPPRLVAQLAADAPAPVQRSESIRQAVRDLLRSGGYRPTGRGKPASEYLLKAATESNLSSINLLVDLCNVTSLHSGLPISVVDLDRVRPPLRILTAEEGVSYVFNASGQTIDLGGLLVLADADGPRANGVKDSESSKTRGDTRRSLSVVWGTRALPGYVDEVVAWYVRSTEEVGLTIASGPVGA